MWRRGGDSGWLLCEEGVFLLWEQTGASCEGWRGGKEKRSHRLAHGNMLAGLGVEVG